MPLWQLGHASARGLCTCACPTVLYFCSTTKITPCQEPQEERCKGFCHPRQMEFGRPPWQHTGDLARAGIRSSPGAAAWQCPELPCSLLYVAGFPLQPSMRHARCVHATFATPFNLPPKAATWVAWPVRPALAQAKSSCMPCRYIYNPPWNASASESVQEQCRAMGDLLCEVGFTKRSAETITRLKGNN